MLDAMLDYVQQGGWVMLPLLGVSAVMWALILERWYDLRRLVRGDLEVPAVLATVRGERPAPRLAGLRAELVQAFLAERCGRARLDREILAQCASRLDQRLEQRHEAIAVLAAVAPLLGLLGTVLGMIETFEVIRYFGTGNARALAGGISVALVTTQTGLLVAIPGLIFGSRLRDRAEQLRHRLAETAQLLDRDLQRRAAAASGGAS
ncbi:MAG: MotA/TolQ/ExbB proton channel family protein [Candidatus Krumholzibacteria bacterium]|nr:MotA/TolQ/ExbB proton channel family protein [Candidatus Krumholzibacteria bacterium]